MQCPKCNYEPTMAEMQASPDRCPSCGVYYAKVNKQNTEAAPPDSSRPASSSEASSGEIIKVKKGQLTLVAALLAGLVIGYFAGREHVKYEFRSAIQDSLAGIGAAFGGAKKSEAKLPPPAPKQVSAAKSVMSGAVLQKGFLEGEYGQDSITLDMQFANTSGKDIRAFEGVMTFRDLLGNLILNLNVAINDPITKGTVLEWSGGIDYNQFTDSHQRLRGESLENIKAEFVVRKILYADGELKEF